MGKGHGPFPEGIPAIMLPGRPPKDDGGAAYRVEVSSAMSGASQRTAERVGTAGGTNEGDERATTDSIV